MSLLMSIVMDQFGHIGHCAPAKKDPDSFTSCPGCSQFNICEMYYRVAPEYFSMKVSNECFAPSTITV